jgi:hypothetical protein
MPAQPNEFLTLAITVGFFFVIVAIAIAVESNLAKRRAKNDGHIFTNVLGEAFRYSQEKRRFVRINNAAK